MTEHQPAVPEGMPSLPFGMEWKEKDGAHVATISLENNSRLWVVVQETWVADGEWKFSVGFSLFYDENEASWDSPAYPAYPTPQKAAKAAVDLLAPFIQLSKMHHG